MVAGSGSNEAKKARIDEAKRQATIRAGTSRVNSIFDGGTFGTDQLNKKSAFDPNATYYDANGNPLTGLDPKKFSRQAARGGIFGGTDSAQGLGDNFFSDRKQAYLDYATPQLEQQYGDAQKEMTYALARNGTLNSSVRGDKTSELQRLFDTNQRKVADDALSIENQSRTAVEDARSNLITTLNATGDAQGAANAALARSSALAQPTAYSPLAQLFSDFTNTLGTNYARDRAAAASSYFGSNAAPGSTTAGRVKVT